MFDRRHIDPSRIAALPARLGGFAQPPYEFDRPPPLAEEYECKTRGRPCWQYAKGRGGDDAEGAFRADEQINQIHPRRREVSRRQLRHRRHLVTGDIDSDGPAGDVQREISVLVRARLSALDVQDDACWEHDGDGLHPVPRRAVLERRCAGGVRRNNSSNRRAEKRRRRRIRPARLFERDVELGDRDAGLHAHVVCTNRFDVVEARKADESFAHRRGAACERRLGADRQDRGGLTEELRDLRLARRRRERRRVPAGEMGRVFKM